MNTLNDSVIICDTPPKSTKKKAPLGTKREQKGRKKTFYESPLKHIQLSSKRWKQIQTQQKLMSNAKQIINHKKNSSLLIKDTSFQDSIIVLSDNESESSNQKDQSNCAGKRKRKRSVEMVIEDNQHSQCLRDSNKSLREGENRIEIRPKKRKKNSPLLPDNNVSCLLISDTEDSEIVPVDSDENIAPASGSMNQNGDDIVVVWSSKKSSPLSATYSGGEKALTEEENKIFMVDPCPNLENLSLLECNKESTSDRNIEGNAENDVKVTTDKSTEAVIEKATEATTEKVTEDNAETSDEEEDSEYLPFSKEGLKLPKAHNISKKLVIQKPQGKTTFLQYRNRVSQLPSTQQINSRPVPVWCTQVSSELFRNEPPRVECGYKSSRFEFGCKPPRELFTRRPRPRWEQSKLDPSKRQLSRWDSSNNDPSIVEPPRREPFELEPSRREPSELEPSKPESSKVESSTSANKLREIIIDGNNVAMAYKNNRMFSEEGIMIVMDYFQRRGHNVKIFVPQYRRSRFSPLLEKLYTEGVVIFTPSRKIGGRSIIPYDDRFILEYATMSGGIVISSDQYRDLYQEKPEWRDTIENRLLPPTFVGNYVMFPEDPLGRNGPKLEEFLRH